MLHLLSHTLMAALAVQRPAVFQRHIAPMMGGAMQKAWGAGGERLSLLVSGGAAAAAQQQQQQQSTGQGGGEGQRKSGDLSASGVHRLSMLSLFG